MIRLPASIVVLIAFALGANAQQRSFPIFTKNSKVTIVYDSNAPKIDSIAANLLALDIERITSYKPKLVTDVSKATGNIIVIGAAQSLLVQQFAGKALYEKLNGKWECFTFSTLDKPSSAISKAFIIAGSDARGTAFGVFTLSEKLGVSPWYWWADVPVKKQQELIISQDDYISSPPSVKYRGIFINDEDWGLMPWAANTFEPEKKNIGPRTYEKVFELLLRLKANLLWPAMHPGTQPFYNDPANAKMAAAYAVIVGSSHAEPMMRNNVGEWDEKTMGHFNYLTNKEKVYKYWEDRVKQSRNNDVIYTLGMRGVHDSGMEGVKDPKEAAPLLEKIIADQRGLLGKYKNEDVTTVPQVFTAYKEVLDIYDRGLKLPDDVTIVWPDDNYGYIQRLNNDEEKKRSGGSGIYYHASYWGRPHDYLWLSSTHPSLIREEMMKAFESGADRLWVLNVGDIKPLEYNMQLFLDMAYNVAPFRNSGHTKQHLGQWHERIFGKSHADVITGVLWEYYDLAFERRPEFMGWSQTEPTTKTRYTSYNHFYFGDEAQRRINKYNSLQKTVNTLRNNIKGDESDAFYQLVYYPVVCASLMNKKFLYRDKSYVYAKQNRINAFDYAILSKSVYDSIVKETDFFNGHLSKGKWKGMMSMKPRDLPVFHAPDIASISLQKAGSWNAIPEGDDTIKTTKKLPVFTAGLSQQFFIDVFLSDSINVSWNAKPSANWLILSQRSGMLTPVQGKNSLRLWVSVDWKKLSKTATGVIEISGAGKKILMTVEAFKPVGLSNYKGFIESNGYVSMHANNYSNKQGSGGSDWQLTQGTGHSGASLTAVVTNAAPDTASIPQTAAYVAYEFYSFSNASLKVIIHTLPTHPLNKNFSMRYGVSIDDGPVKIIDFKTVGRSEEWKQNVLRNSAIKPVEFPARSLGKHTLKVYAIDPGVILDRIVIEFGNQQKVYGGIKETFPSLHLHPNRRMIATLFPTSNILIYPRGYKPLLKMRAQQKMIYPQPGISAISIPEIIPESINNLFRIQLAQSIRPALVN